MHRRYWEKSLLIAACLALCNFFPAPPPLIRARNHSRALMREATQTLRQSAAPGSVIFADYQSGLLLGYYLCDDGVVEMFPPFPPFVKSECGAYTVITARPQEWKFYAEDLPKQFAAATADYGLTAATPVWLFNAGWINDSVPAMINDSRRGCSMPRSFGENIFLCRLTVPPNAMPVAQTKSK